MNLIFNSRGNYYYRIDNPSRNIKLELSATSGTNTVLYMQILSGGDDLAGFLNTYYFNSNTPFAYQPNNTIQYIDIDTFGYNLTFTFQLNSNTISNINFKATSVDSNNTFNVINAIIGIILVIALTTFIGCVIRYRMNHS